MYDTEKRVELVKKRVLEKYRRKERRGICRLSALCMALSAFLVGTVHTAAGQTQITARGMYGSILLHEDAGGYVLVRSLRWLQSYPLRKERQRRY